MSVKYTAYKLISADGSILVDTNFQQAISVKQAAVRQVLADLQSFAINGKSENNSELTVNFDGKVHTISRDYRSSKLDTQPPFDPETARQAAAWSNNFIVVPPELNPQFQRQLIAVVGSLAGDQVSQPAQDEQIKQEIIKEGGELGEKYLEIIQKINAIEVELGNQKRMDEGVLSLGELETALGAIDDQIASVRSLLEKQTQINQTLVKYGQLAQRDLETESVKLREQLEKLRQEELVGFSHDHGFDPVAASKVTETDIKKEAWHASYLVILAVVSILVGLGGFALSQNSILIVLSVVVAIIELGIFGALNYIPSQIDVYNLPFEKVTSNQGVSMSTEPNEKQGIIARIEKFFVDKAWVSALKSEAKYMNDTISAKLEGKDIAELQTAQSNLKSNIEILKAEIEKFKADEIPPQEYLQKRRELDMLNIDKARSERDLRNSPNGSKVIDLLTQLTEQQGEGIKKGFVLEDALAQALSVNSVVVANEAVEFALTDGTAKSAEEVEPNIMYAFVTWYRLLEWQKSPQSPFVLVEPLTEWPNTFKVLVDNKLSELRALGQLVSIQLLP